jgi:hypothetical protein
LDEYKLNSSLDHRGTIFNHERRLKYRNKNAKFPGPAYYPQESLQFTQKGRKVESFSKEPKSNITQISQDDVCGPGRYETHSSFRLDKKPSSLKGTFGGLLRNPQKKTLNLVTPGPGAYYHGYRYKNRPKKCI